MKSDRLENNAASTYPILWLDCIGGITVGLIVLALSQWLSHWERLPIHVVIFMGLANLAYGTFSLFVATRQIRPAWLITTLASANMLWIVVCIVIACRWWEQISILGLAHVMGEGIYVFGLGLAEWRLRQKLVSPPV